MKIPKGMTREQVCDVIDRVSDRFGRLKFDIYGSDDIKQEAALLCIDALDRYEIDRGPLENFLMVHTRNRLLSLIRNKSNNKTDKYLINWAIPIHNINEELENSMKYDDEIHSQMIADETMSEINTRVPIDRRVDLIKMLNGIKISKTRREAIIELVGDLFEL